MTDYSTNILGSGLGAAFRAFQAQLGFQRTPPATAKPAAKSATSTSTSTPALNLHRDQFVPSPASAQRPAASTTASNGSIPGIQVHVNVPWKTEGPPWTGCKPTSIAMARAAGANPQENNRITNPAQGRAYIDSQLALEKPAVVGVDHPGGRHVVVVTGRGVDQNGTFYTFNDPGTANPAVGKDTRQQNRFYVNGNGGLYRPATGLGGGVVNMPYSVWSVMKNA